MSKRPDEFGDACKHFEMMEAGRKADRNYPLLARLDGRAFHSYCRGLKRPYDDGFITAMVETTKALIGEFHPAFGYVQSDEITLAWWIPPGNEKSQFPFDGRYQKLTSVLAGFASAVFNRQAVVHVPSKVDKIAMFDCRVWQVPSLKQAEDVFVWRRADAIKNSVTMAAGAYYSHKELLNKSSLEKIKMLREKGVEFDHYPERFKEGTLLKRVAVEAELTAEERERIPEKFRPPLGQKMIRSRVQPVDARVRVLREILFGTEVADAGN